MHDTWQQDVLVEAGLDEGPGSMLSGFGTAPGAPRQHRRLPERILVAAHQACDLGALQTAGSLLSILEIVLMQPAGGSATAHRRTVEGMVAAYERLWHLRRAVAPTMS